MQLLFLPSGLPLRDLSAVNLYRSKITFMTSSLRSLRTYGVLTSRDGTIGLCSGYIKKKVPVLYSVNLSLTF